MPFIVVCLGLLYKEQSSQQPTYLPSYQVQSLEILRITTCGESTFLAHSSLQNSLVTIQERQEKTTKHLSETIDSKHVCNMKMDNITIDLSLAQINTYNSTNTNKEDK
jgi:hypothetical protein